MKQNNLTAIKNRLIKMICIGTFGGCIYVGCEYIFRGYSHPTMFLLAFFVSQLLMILNDTILEMNDYYEYQLFCGTFICTVFEYIFGIIFNSNYTIWDYRNMPFTLHFLDDQVNLIFILAWLFICSWGIPLMDYLQWRSGLGERPYYRVYLLNKTIYL